MSNAFVPTVENRKTRHFKRRSALAVSSALLAAAAAAVVPFQSANAAPAGDDGCVLQELPMPADKYFSLVTGMSDDGDVIAYRVYPAGLEGDERDMYLYEDGDAVRVPIPGIEQQLSDVNSDGLAVGSAWVDGVQLPYVYRDGEVAELAANEGGAAIGVNEDGDIVGFAGQDRLVPVVWRDGQVKPVELPLPEGAVGGAARAIDDEGTIVGTYGTEDGYSRPYVWHPDGTGEELPVPDGVDPAGALLLSADDVAEAWVVGGLLTPEREAGVRWNLEDGTVEVLDLVYAAGINEEGTAVGESSPHAGFQEREGKVVDLPGLSDPADNWFGDIATEISDDGELMAGQVYAGQDDADNHILKAVAWTCD